MSGMFYNYTLGGFPDGPYTASKEVYTFGQDGSYTKTVEDLGTFDCHRAAHAARVARSQQDERDRSQKGALV